MKETKQKGRQHGNRSSRVGGKEEGRGRRKNSNVTYVYTDALHVCIQCAL